MLRVEGEDLQRQVGPFGLPGEPLELVVHDRVVADPALQDRFVQHHRQLQPVAIQHLLPAHPDPDQPPDHAGCDRLDPAVAADDVARVVLGLQQAGNDVDMPDGHGRRLVLKPDELLVVLGQAVGELLPPALLRSVLGQPEQELPVRSGDLVIVEQPLDLPGPQAGPGPLVPADLRGRPLQRRGDRVSALAFVFPDPAQFGGQPAPPYRGASRRDHRAFLLLGAARADQCDGHADFSEICALSLLVPMYSPIVTITRVRLPATSPDKIGHFAASSS